jgi:hypothetical protein
MKEGQTLALDSAVPNAGTGITFPATQSASSDANTLDDYEEGTWTPTVTNAGITSYSSSGIYTKIGNAIYLQAKITLTNVGTASGSMSIQSLPFTPASGSKFASAYRNDSTGVMGFTSCEGSTLYVLSPTWTNTYIYFANVVYTV